ncbi:MAG: hypothetical protein KJ939_03250 [Nanoarchaeota archaeon]|nr:hypothetical protein [Nanoarchaeota archaeon]
MKKLLQIGLCSLVLAGSVPATITTYNGLQETEAKLVQHYDYNEANKLKSIYDLLNCAHNELVYTPSRISVSTDSEGNVKTDYHPAVHPDVKNAKICLKKAVNGMNNLGANLSIEQSKIKKLENKLNKFQDVKDILISLDSILPNENDMENYKGKKVDNNTFANERMNIGHMIAKVENARQQHYAKVPKELKNAKFSNILGLISSSFLGISALIAGLYFNFRRKE